MIDRKDKIVVYPGSFDPITYGHKDVILRALKLYDRVHVLVVENRQKKSWFSLEERLDMIIKTVPDKNNNMTVAIWNDLFVYYMNKVGANICLRSFRSEIDKDVELGMYHMNKRLKPDMEQVFLASSDKYGMLSSTAVRDIASYEKEKELLYFVDPYVADKLIKRAKEKFGIKESK